MKPKRNMMIKLLNDPAALHAKLQTEPLFVREQDEDGRTLLHHAAETFNMHTFQSMEVTNESLRLLSACQSIDVNIQDNEGNTVFHQIVLDCLGAHYGNSNNLILRLLTPLTTHSPDYSIRNNKGVSALHLAVSHQGLGRGALAPEPSHLLIFSTKEKLVKTLLNNSTFTTNQLSSEGKTALYYAIADGHFTLARYLLERGANPCLHSTVNPLNLIIYLKSYTSFIETNCAINDPHRTGLFENMPMPGLFFPPKEAITKRMHDTICTLEEMMNDIAQRYKSSFSTIKSATTALVQGRRMGYPFTLFSNELISKIAKYTNESNLISDLEAEKLSNETLVSQMRSKS